MLDGILVRLLLVHAASPRWIRMMSHFKVNYFDVMCTIEYSMGITLLLNVSRVL